jgi:hypothetical protein
MAEPRARRDDLAAELLAETDDEAAYQSEERAAVIAEGDPAAAVPHDMPVSWADPDIVPTPGARCRCFSDSIFLGAGRGGVAFTALQVLKATPRNIEKRIPN